MAVWTAVELFNELGGAAAIALTPESGGRFEVYFDGNEAFDKKKAGGFGYAEIQGLKMAARERVGL
ncbi:MAG: Rdx family protein [Dehalococcoidia bacterium]